MKDGTKVTLFRKLASFTRISTISNDFCSLLGQLWLLLAELIKKEQKSYEIVEILVKFALFLK